MGYRGVRGLQWEGKAPHMEPYLPDYDCTCPHILCDMGWPIEEEGGVLGGGGDAFPPQQHSPKLTLLP